MRRAASGGAKDGGERKDGATQGEDASLTAERPASDVTAVTSPTPDPESDPDHPQATLADGLVLMAESALARGPAARRAGERNQLIVQLGPEQLDSGERGTCRGDERPRPRVGTPNRERSERWRAELLDGTWLSGQAFERFSCDCAVTVVKTGADGTPLGVGRKQRTIAPSLWTALLTRPGGGCEAPGCSSRIFLQAHHIQPWSQGGPTNLDSLMCVCGCCMIVAEHYLVVLTDDCSSGEEALVAGHEGR